MEQNGFTAQEVLRNIVFNSLQTIEIALKRWYTYSDGQFMNGVRIAQVEASFEYLQIVKVGYLGVSQIFKVEEQNGQPILYYRSKNDWQTITIEQLCEMFGFHYYTMVKIAEK